MFTYKLYNSSPAIVQFIRALLMLFIVFTVAKLPPPRDTGEGQTPCLNILLARNTDQICNFYFRATEYRSLGLPTHLTKNLAETWQRISQIRNGSK